MEIYARDLGTKSRIIGITINLFLCMLYICMMSSEKYTHSQDIERKPIQVEAISSQEKKETKNNNNRLIEDIKSENSKDKIKSADKIEIIVHPLYKMLFEDVSRHINYHDGVDILSIIKNGGIEAGVTTIARSIVEKIKEGIAQGNTIPGGIFALRDLLEEYHEYKNHPQGSLRVFMLPNHDEIQQEFKNNNLARNNVNGISPVIEAYNIFLKEQSGNVLVMESVSDSNGEMTDSDREFLRKEIKSGCTVELQGGYNGGCVRDAAIHLSDIAATRSDIHFQVDYVGLTESMLGMPGFWSRNINTDQVETPKLLAPTGNIDERTLNDINEYLLSNKNTLQRLSSFEKKFYEDNDYEGDTGFKNMEIVFPDSDNKGLDDRLEKKLHE